MLPKLYQVSNANTHLTTVIETGKHIKRIWCFLSVTRTTEKSHVAPTTFKLK